MIFDAIIIFDEEQVGELGHKVAPGQHNAMLWKLKWRKVPFLWEISFAKKNGVLDLSIPSLIYTQVFFPKVDCFLITSHHNTMLRELDLRKVLLLWEGKPCFFQQRPEALF